MYAAAVCRKNQGSILQLRINKWPGSIPLKGEARAARMALSLVAEFDDWAILIEGDALGLIQQVTESTLSSNPGLAYRW